MNDFGQEQRPKPRLGCLYVVALIIAAVSSAALVATFVASYMEGRPCGECEEGYGSILVGVFVFVSGVPALSALFVFFANRSRKRRTAAFDAIQQPRDHLKDIRNRTAPD